MDDFVVSSPAELPRQIVVGEFLLDRETIRRRAGIGLAEKAFDAPSIVPDVSAVSNKAALPAAWKAY